MLEPFSISCQFSSKEIVSTRIQLWTNIITKNSAEQGKWHGIELNLIEENSNDGQSLFGISLKAIRSGNFEFTLRYRKQHGTPWIWIGNHGNNGKLQVLPPNPQTYPWSQGPIVQKVLEGLFIGNFIAASDAFEMGFSAILNLAEELNYFDTRLKCKKLGCKDGPKNEICEEKIKESVEWIKQNLERKEKNSGTL